MMNNLLSYFLLVVIFFGACRPKQKDTATKETRTSGATSIAIDQTFGDFLDSQIDVFKSDYPNASIQTIVGNENELLPQFAEGKIKIMIFSRMLKPKEELYYTKRKSPIDIDRIAVDGIALIRSKQSTDTLVSVEELYEVMRGKATTNKKLVFDNAYSSTIRYFIDSAGIKALPSTGVYTLKTGDEVIQFVTKNSDYIGVIGLNYLLGSMAKQESLKENIRILSVKKGNSDYFKPTQKNLMNGKYPFLRNIYVINAEGTNGLGTGFANWLSSPRGQLIVLKSGLAPHEVAERELNILTKEKK